MGSKAEYTDEELAIIQKIAESEKVKARPIEGRKEKRAAIRAQAKRNRAQILTTIVDQGPGVWLEEARRKRDDVEIVARKTNDVGSAESR